MCLEMDREDVGQIARASHTTARTLGFRMLGKSLGRLGGESWEDGGQRTCNYS